MNWRYCFLGLAILCELFMLYQLTCILCEYHCEKEERKRKYDQRNSKPEQAPSEPLYFPGGSFVDCSDVGHQASEVEVLISENALGVRDRNIIGWRKFKHLFEDFFIGHKKKECEMTPNDPKISDRGGTARAGRKPGARLRKQPT